MTPEDRKKIDDAFDAEYKKMPAGQWGDELADKVRLDYKNLAEGKTSRAEWQRQLHDFGAAPVVAEGQLVYPELASDSPNKTQIETTYIEFSLPREWEKECEEMIENWLKEKTAATGLDWN